MGEDVITNWYAYRLVDIKEKRDPWRLMVIHRRTTVENGKMRSIFGPGSKSLKRLAKTHDSVCTKRAMALGYILPEPVIPTSGSIIFSWGGGTAASTKPPYPGITTWTSA